MSSPPHQYTITMKFGGTSVGNAEAISRVARIVQHARENTLHRTDHISERWTVVVVSAMNGVTDSLIRAAQSAVAGEHAAVERIRRDLRQRHVDTLAHLELDNGERLSLEGKVDALVNHAHSLYRAAAVLGELTPRGLDVVAGLGERLSAHIVAAALRARGLPAQAIEATTLIVTDDCFGAASPLMDETSILEQLQLGILIGTVRIVLI